MWIYKITNIQNNKVYIGQSIRPIEDRFERHINDALHNILDTHLARAIRKYGKDNFYIEEIDSATTQEELTEKEQYWIRYYDSVKTGYNETDALNKCGGNTYKSKTPKEMEVIKNKIRNNPMIASEPTKPVSSAMISLIFARVFASSAAWISISVATPFIPLDGW